MHETQEHHKCDIPGCNGTRISFRSIYGNDTPTKEEARWSYVDGKDICHQHGNWTIVEIRQAIAQVYPNSLGKKRLD